MSVELARVWTVEDVVKWIRERGLSDITLSVGYADFYTLKAQASGPRERARSADLAAKFASATGVMPHVFVEFNLLSGKYLYPDPACYPVITAAVPYVRLDCTKPERARKCWEALQHLSTLLKIQEPPQLLEALRDAAFPGLEPPTAPRQAQGGEESSGGAVESAADEATAEVASIASGGPQARRRGDSADEAAVEVASTEVESVESGVEEEASGVVGSVETAGARAPPGGDVGLVLKILGVDLAPLIERYGERAVRGLRAFVELAERRPEVLDDVRERLVNGGGCRVVEEVGCDAVTDAWDTVTRLRRLYGNVDVLLDEDVAYVAKKFAALDEETRERVLKAFEAL